MPPAKCEYPVPGKLPCAHQPFAPFEDNGQQNHGKHDHAHSGNAGNLDYANIHRLLEKTEPFQQDGDDGRAEYAACKRAEPAGHDKHEHVESQQEIEHLGVDCGKMAAEQAAADASEKGSDAEGKYLVLKNVDAHD